MHVHIAMIGEATQPITKAFQALGFDKLYLLFSPKYRDSVDSVREFLKPFNVDVDTEKVTGFDFQEIVNAIYRIYEKEESKDVSFSINITGGTNLMAAAACSCAFFIGATIYYVLKGDGPVKDQVCQIPTPKTPNMAALKPESRSILRFILEETEGRRPVTTASLMDRFDRTKQSINYQMNILRSEDLIENADGVSPLGKPDKRYRTIVLTRQGRLIASWI